MNPTVTIAAILVGMALIGLIETLVPLHARGPVHRAHVWPNLVLTAITFATNLVFNVAVVAVLVWQAGRGIGLLHWSPPSPWVAVVLALAGLEFSFYAAHVAMHASETLWRFHRVHHSDAAVDVTTTIRQHPGEGVIRYTFMAAAAFALGVSPGAFAVYRLWSVLAGLVEHANVSLPRGMDRLLAMVVVTPDLHKIHHSRRVIEADSNYGNLTSVFDRVFGTFTASERGPTVVTGLDGFDDPAMQSARGLLVMPFRRYGRAVHALLAP